MIFPALTAAFLNPQAGDTTKATVTIGGKDQDVNIDKSGNLTAADDGAVLYMDATGNLTKNNAGGDTQATLAKLATATGAKAATIQTDKGTFTSDGTAFDGASMSIDANTFANAVKK